MTFRDVPKVELHTHLEGAAPPAFIRQLAQEKNIRLDGIFDESGGYVFENFQQFLDAYDAACEPLKTTEDFYRLTMAVLEETASHGVIYMESFVSPDYCGGGDVVKWRDYVAAMAQAATDGEKAFGITLKGIATCIRHRGPEASKSDSLCAAETAGDFITGFGMAGAEMMHQPSDFAYAFDQAREAGLSLTCHAGEWGGPDRIRETLDVLKVNRLGHGIRAIDDLDLVRRIVEEDIVLEVCPGSNVILKAVDGWDSHPIAKLRDLGVKVTFSTDDPPFFHTTMTAECEGMHRTFGWDKDDFIAMGKTAIDAAYCDADTRSRIRKQLESA